MHRLNVISVKMVYTRSVMTLVAQIVLVRGTQQTSMSALTELAKTSQLHYQDQILIIIIIIIIIIIMIIIIIIIIQEFI